MYKNKNSYNFIHYENSDHVVGLTSSPRRNEKMIRYLIQEDMPSTSQSQDSLLISKVLDKPTKIEEQRYE